MHIKVVSHGVCHAVPNDSKWVTHMVCHAVVKGLNGIKKGRLLMGQPNTVAHKSVPMFAVFYKNVIMS